MPSHARAAPGGLVHHALNQATARLTLFRKKRAYEAFLDLLGEAMDRHPTRMLGFCLMPTHWHFVLWPAKDGEMTAFLRWLTMTHAVRWHTHYCSLGSGHLYQGRYKSFPVKTDDLLDTLLRSVERKPLRANLVARAEDWRCSRLGLRQASVKGQRDWRSAWPVPRPDGWAEHVNVPQTEAELTAIRHCVAPGCPYGSVGWSKAIASQLGLEHTLRNRGRSLKAWAAPDLFSEE